jgi:hypothetical protein
MRQGWVFLWLLLAALASCDGPLWPVTTFDAPFPGRYCTLTDLLGDRLLLKREADTLALKISATGKNNLIVDERTGDTLFDGKASMFRGLCYLSQQINDSSYWIHAVRITDDAVHGLTSAWEQTMLVERAVRGGRHPKLVQRITDTEIRLHPDRKAMRMLFSSIIDSIRPDTIIRSHVAPAALRDGAWQPEEIGPEDLEILSRVYPNPTTGILNINLRRKADILYWLEDPNGRVVMEGRPIDTEVSIDLSGLPDGIYILTLMDPIRGWKERVRVVKVQ